MSVSKMSNKTEDTELIPQGYWRTPLDNINLVGKMKLTILRYKGFHKSLTCISVEGKPSIPTGLIIPIIGLMFQVFHILK